MPYAVRLLLISLVTAACVLTLAAPAPAKPKVRDDIVGAMWKYTLKREGEAEKKGEFRVFRGEIFLKDKKIGTLHKKDEDESTLIIGGLPELNGTAVVRNIKKKPVTAVGKFRRTDGTEWEIRIEVFDR
jgi:hypothetical protein